MVAQMEKTKSEIIFSGKNISDEIYIGGGKTEGIRLIAKVEEKYKRNILIFPIIYSVATPMM